ncbi:MAG TPA: phosphatase PAP2 family protein [Pilimelia sp.]|nr:phosphatase PAP2 family protein [Pilimelia sp.]
MDGARVASLRRLEHFTGRSVVGLLAVVGVGAGFGLLLMLVRFRWDPLYRIDHGVADWLNNIVSAHAPLVAVLEALTDLGGRPIMMWLIVIVVISLLIRGQRRLAVYLIVTGVGALMLDPSLKLIVGRLRPVVEAPVASAPGNSFPSGHALGSTVAYGALLLIFLPVASRRVRAVAISIFATIVVLVGFTRVALGVHYVSDVLAGWLLGLAWLGVTAYAFRLWRREAGKSEPPLTEGIEPEAADEIAPAPHEHHLLPHPRTGVAEIVTGWVLIFGVLFVFGVLVSRYAGGTVIEAVDDAVPRWFAAHRTPTLNEVSWWMSKGGDTHAVLAVSLVFCPLVVAALRRWRPVLFVALALLGELTLFLASAAAVDRPRPDVPHLDGPLPTSSFPSGHIAATICLYATIAIIVMSNTDRWWRWLTVAAVVIMPAAVAISRIYRGMHHPTDTMGAVLLAAMWLTVLWWVIRPEAPDTEEEPVTAPAQRQQPRESIPATRA